MRAIGHRAKRMGREFRAPARLQRGFIALLDRSPMPWTYGMLDAWFGLGGGASVLYAAENKRIWRIERGMYASNKHYTPQPITDEWIEKRFGIKL